jgi:hypothetical protein
MVDGRDHGPAIGPSADGDAHLGDDVVELVLGTVDGARRTALAAHVLVCAACRREYDELLETVERLLPAVPATQPPLGFDERVLTALAPGRATVRSRPAWHRVAVAAALLAVVVPVGAWLAGRDDGRDDGRDVRGDGAVATLRAADGAPVGTVSIATVADDPVMVVALVGAPPDVGYFCRTHLADGTVTDSPSWPPGNGAWIVPLPPGAEVTAVEVIPAGTDHVWSSARFA